MTTRRAAGCLATILFAVARAQEPGAAPSAAPPITDPLARALNQAGADELARICAQPANKGSRPCRALKRKCDELKKGRPSVTPLACREPPVAAIVDAGEPKKVPNPRAFPAALALDVSACREDGAGCLTLADFHARYDDGFEALSAWCLTRRLENDEGAFEGRARRAAKRVCDALARTTAADTKELARVPTFYLFVLEEAASQEILSCSGFGLTFPFVRVRYPTKDDADVSGPVAAGLGGGYYFALTCQEDWSWGLDAFAYSEGIDLTNDRAQFGVAAGAGVVAYRTFRFGIDLGYDLYRQEQDGSGAVVRNGLFGFKNLGRPSLSYLFTLSFQSRSPEKKARPEPD